MADADLTAQRLRELLDYDPETGIFTRRIFRSANAKAGDKAGALMLNGYSAISINKKSFYCHRLAWLYTNGKWPNSCIDHIDGNRLNNAISNLRDLPQRINNQNIAKARAHNTTKHLGVKKNNDKWGARIGLDGKAFWLGTFKTPELAHAAYLEAKRRLHAGCTI